MPQQERARQSLEQLLGHIDVRPSMPRRRGNSLLCGAGVAVMVATTAWLVASSLDMRARLHTQAEHIAVLEARLTGKEFLGDATSTVAEYDMRHSYISGPCLVGRQCTAQYRVRRTPTGKDCGKPDLTPYVVSLRDGTRYRVSVPRFKPIKADTDWELVEIDFVAPAIAQPGLYGFTFDATFHCPAPMNPRTVNGNSPPLAFDLKT